MIAERVEHAVLGVGQHVRELGHVAQGALGAGRRLPDAARRIGARIDAGDRAARADVPEPNLVERIGRQQPREVHGGVPVAERALFVSHACMSGGLSTVARDVDDQERSPLHAVRLVLASRRLRGSVASSVAAARDAQDVEQAHVLERVQAGLGGA